MEFLSCPRDHARLVRAAAGSALCSSCIRQLERNLRELPGIHLEFLHDMSSISWRTNPTKVSGTRRRDRVDVSLFDIRHDILTILESWSGVIVEKLGTAAPARSVPHLTRFLLLHLDWLTTQSPAAEFADEIERLRHESLHAIDRAPDGSNPLIIECVVESCHGTINVPPKTTRLSCSSGHSWEMHEWLALRHLKIDKEKGSTA